MKNILILDRVASFKGMGVFGELTMPSGRVFTTVEREWKDNANSISCIPSGAYSVGKHNSPLMTRLSKGKYTQAWEIQGVKDRSYILFHQANVMWELEGCVGLGLDWGWLKTGKAPKAGLAVTSSVAAVDLFMKEMEELEGGIEVIVRWSYPEFYE